MQQEQNWNARTEVRRILHDSTCSVSSVHVSNSYHPFVAPLALPCLQMIVYDKPRFDFGSCPRGFFTSEWGALA